MVIKLHKDRGRKVSEVFIFCHETKLVFILNPNVALLTVADTAVLGDAVSDRFSSVRGIVVCLL